MLENCFWDLGHYTFGGRAPSSISMVTFRNARDNRSFHKTWGPSLDRVPGFRQCLGAYRWVTAHSLEGVNIVNLLEVEVLTKRRSLCHWPHSSVYKDPGPALEQSGCMATLFLTPLRPAPPPFCGSDLSKVLWVSSASLPENGTWGLLVRFLLTWHS